MWVRYLAIGQIEPQRDLRIGLHKSSHLRRYVAPPETGRCRNSEVTAGANAAERHRGLGVGQVIEYPLTIFEKSLAFEGQGQLARRA